MHLVAPIEHKLLSIDSMEPYIYFDFWEHLVSSYNSDLLRLPNAQIEIAIHYRHQIFCIQYIRRTRNQSYQIDPYFWYKAWPFHSRYIFCLCYQRNSLTAKIGKWRKLKFCRIYSCPSYLILLLKQFEKFIKSFNFFITDIRRTQKPLKMWSIRLTE